MLEKLKDKFLKFNEVVGIEVQLFADGFMSFYGVHVKTVKGAIEKISTFENIKSLQALKEKIPDNIPICVSFNGVGLLTREKPLNEIGNPITTFFPGSNPNEFLYSIQQIGELIARVTIVRRELIEARVNELLNQGLPVVDVFVGCYCIENILPFMLPGEAVIETAAFTFTIQKNTLQSVENIARLDQVIFEEIPVGGTYYRSLLLPALGNALEIMGSRITDSPSIPTLSGLENKRNDYNYFRLFKLVGWTMLITILTILLANYFLFNHYFAKNQEMLLDKITLTEQNKQAQGQNAKLDSNYNFLVVAGWDKNSRHSYFIDRIAALVPETISLTSLQSAPPKTDMDVHDYLFDTKKIIIQGASYDPSDLDVFVNSIKNIPDVQMVSLTDYLYKREIKGAVFTIDITTQ